MNNYVITIAREFGTGGKEIGGMLSKELGIPCYESEILDMASEFSGLNRKLFEKQNDKLAFPAILARLRAKPDKELILEPSDHEFVAHDNLFNIQCHIIKQLALNSSCIIIGKCANDVLRGFGNVISVFIHAPQEARVETVGERLGIAPDEANRTIYRTDRYRSQYYKYYSGGKVWNDPKEYDLMINTERTGKKHAAPIILAYAKSRFPKCFSD